MEEHGHKESRDEGAGAAATATVEPTPTLSPPPPPTTETEGQTSPLTPAKTAAGRRSRKEKPIVRSFSTELEQGMESKVIENSDGKTSKVGKSKKSGGVRNRRTLSAPVVGNAGDGNESEISQIATESGSKTAHEMLPPSEVSSMKKITKRKQTEMEYEEEEEYRDFIFRDYIMANGDHNKNKKPQLPRSQSQPARRANPRSPQSPRKNKSPKRRLEFLSPPKPLGKQRKRRTQSARDSPHINFKGFESTPPKKTSISFSPIRLPVIPPKATLSASSSLNSPQRELVAYRVSDKFLKLTEGNKKKEGEMLQTKQLPLAPPPPPLGLGLPSQMSSSSKQPMPQLEIDDRSFLDSLLEDEELPFNEGAEYEKGLATLQSVLKPLYKEGGGQFTITVPQFCKEAVGRLAGVLSNEDGNLNAELISHAKKILVNGNIGNNEELKHDAAEFCPQKFVVDSVLTSPVKKTIYPRVSADELDAFNSLMEPDPDFKCYEDEQEAANLYCELIRSELQAELSEQQRLKEVEPLLQKTNPGADSSSGERKVVMAMAIPVIGDPKTLNEQYDGLFLTKGQLVEKITNSKSQLKEHETRRLRNFKELVLERVQESEPKQTFSSPRDELFSKITGKAPKGKKNKAPATVTSEETNGQEEDKEASNEKFVKRGPWNEWLDHFPAPEKSKVTEITLPGNWDQFVNNHGKGEAPRKKRNASERLIPKDDYSERVEANLRRLEIGLPPADGIKSLPRASSSSATSSSSSTTTSRSNRPWNLTNLGRNSAFNLPSLPSLTPQSTSSFQNGQPPQLVQIPSSSPGFGFEAQRPFPRPMPNLASMFPGTNQIPGSSSSTETATSNNTQNGSAKSRYSRQKHCTVCPPFENNHCSYSQHFCGNPRAPSSRFCISHAGEGATLAFVRCKYVKGSRECGRYIHRQQPQVLFCDIHALKIANALCKLSRPKKNAATANKVLVKQLKGNLDRAQGKVMEGNGEGGFTVRRDLLADERETLNDSSDSEEEVDDPCVSVADLIEAQKGDDDEDTDDCELNPADPNQPDYSCLRNAGYYTVEECVSLNLHTLQETKDRVHQAMELLKRNYAMQRAQYVRKLIYLRSLHINFTTDPNFLSTKRSGLSKKEIQKQVKVYNDTKARLSHRRGFGPRAVLRKQVLEKRQEMFIASHQVPPDLSSPGPIHDLETDEEVKYRLRRVRAGNATPIICAYGSGGPAHERCSQKVLPLSKFCLRHICHDKTQKLYKQCGFRLGPDPEDVCITPVHTVLEKFGCPLHALPVPFKEPQDNGERRAKIEEEIDNLVDAKDKEKKENEEEEDDDTLDMLLESDLEDLIGDELVDFDHWKEVVSSIYAKGLYETDSEESEDTEEEEDESGVMQI